MKRTCNQALHLLFPLHIYVQSLLQLVVVQVCTTPSSHNTQFVLRRAIELLMFLVQLSNKVNAKVDAMGFEVDKVQSAAIVRGVQLSREIDQFRQRTANLLE